MPPIDEDLLTVTPDSTDAVLWVDMVAFRSSSLFEAIRTLMGDEQLPLMEGGASVNPIDTSNEIVFAFTGGRQDGPDQFLILIKGEFKSSELLDSYAKNHVSDKDQSVSEQFGPFPGIRTPKYLIIALTDRTVALCTDEAASKVVGLAQHQGKSLRAGENFKDLKLDGSAAALLRYRRGIATPDFKRYGKGAPKIEMDSIASLNGSLHLKDGLQAEITATTETQMDASEIVREVKKTIKDLKRNMFVVLIGVDWFFDRITVTGEQSAIQMKLNLTASDIEQLKALADKLRKLKELTEGEDQPENNPFAAPPQNEKKDKQ